MKKTAPLKWPLLSAMALSFAVPPGVAIAEGVTSVSVGLDYASGDYGTAETTRTYSAPLAIKHENGPWTLRASLPYVYAEGTFSRDRGFEGDEPGDDNGGAGTATQGIRSESGLGDLTLGIHYTVLNNPAGFSVDLGGKAKIATADKDKTLITSGENDYSAQIDVFRSLPAVSVFATLGYTIKGEPTGVSYDDPFYGSLGLSVPVSTGKSIGIAWDYREKIVATSDPVSELSAFFSMKLNPNHKMQIYVVHGLSDSSPDVGGGVVLTHLY